MKDVREGYKITELGEIPEAWRIEKLNDICKVRSEKYNPVNNLEKDYIALEHIEQGIGRINGIGKSTETTSMKSIFQKGDVLFGKLRPYLKKYWYAEFDGVCATEILPLITNEKNDSRFCYYIIQQDNFIEYVDKGSFGTKMPRTSWNEMKEFLLPIPPLNEQQKISSILSNVDEQIEITDNLIEKTKELKKGIMQKLLTKGIGHSRFKDTEIGKIPEEWDVRKFGDIFSLMKSGLSRSLKDDDIGIPCIRSNNMVDGRIDKNDLKYWFLEDDKGANINDYVLDDGDILVNFINSIAQIGKACIYSDIGRISIYTTNIFRIKVNIDLVDNKFFYYYTQTTKYNMEIGLITKPAVNQASFTSVDFKNILMPIPSIEEQQKISVILSSVDEQLEQYKSKKEKLQELKKGLMQKLLTGKIRVMV